MRQFCCVWILCIAAGPAAALPGLFIEEFDTRGQGEPSLALRISRADFQSRGLRLSQDLGHVVPGDYCLRYDIAVENPGGDIPDHFLVESFAGDAYRLFTSPKLPPGEVFRAEVTMPVTYVSGGEPIFELVLGNTGGEASPLIAHLDNVRLEPYVVEAERQSQFEQTIWVQESTALGWEHEVLSEVGQVARDFVFAFTVWDDQPEQTGISENVVVLLNDKVVFNSDIGGVPEAPATYSVRLPWLDCLSTPVPEVEARLFTTPVGPLPAGDLFFHSATLTYSVGRLMGTVLSNGAFEEGMQDWRCDSGDCTLTRIEPLSWGQVKQVYR